MGDPLQNYHICQSETRIAHVDHDFCLIGMKSYRRSSTDASYQISKELPIVVYSSIT
jgi:hypothetical protein